MIEVDVPGKGTVEFPDEMSQDDIHAALKKHFSPEPDFSRIKSQPVFQPSQFSFGGGAVVPPSENPDVAFTAATGGSPALALLGAGVGALNKRVIEPIAHEIGKQVFIEPPEEGESIIPESITPLAAPEEKGIIPSLTRTLRGMTTEGGVLTLPMAAAKPVQAYYAAGAVAGIPESVNRIVQAENGPETAGALTEFGVNTAMAGLMGKGLLKEHAATLPRATLEAAKTLSEEGVPNASEISPTTEVHGDVRPRETPASQLPQPEGGAGIQPQTQRRLQTTSQEGQQGLLLKPEDQSYLENERAGIDAPIEVQSGEPTPVGVDVPFAARKWESGDFMRANHQTGKIEVNGPEYSDWLSMVPEDKRPMAVRSRLFEEQQHLNTSPDQAKAYWDTLTPTEKTLEKRIYTGKWQGVPRFTDTQYGFEAIRRQKQRLARMDTSEAAEAALKERWTVKSLEALNATIRSTREALGTKASKEGLAILARIEDNSNAAISALKGGSPAAYNKGERGTSGGKITEKNIESMSDADLIEMFKTVAPHSDAVEYGITKGPEIVPELQRIIKDSTDKAMKAVEEGNDDAATANIGRFTWAAGAIEGANKSGPNYDLYVKQKAEATPAAYNKRKGEITPEFYLPPLPKGAERPSVDVEIPQEARRLKITPADIDWTQRGKEGAYRPITDSEAANPAALGKILTTDARIEGSQSPVSSTRRLTALVDKQNGEVHLVSTYPSGRAGAMIVNPQQAGALRPNVPIADVLERYKPIYSMLRDSPIKNFHQKFDSMDDFQARFGEEATQRSQESLGQAATAMPAGSVEGSVEPVYPTEFEKAVPTDAELKAFHDFFEGEIPQTKNDFDRLIGNAYTRASRQMASAVHKAFMDEQAANPKASPEANLEDALSKLYEDLKSETRTDFIRNAQARIGQRMAGQVQEGRLAKQPAAFNKAKESARAEFDGVTQKIRAAFSRHTAKEEISVLADKATTISTNLSQETKRNIQQPSSSAKLKNGDANILSSARAINAAGEVPDKAKLDDFIRLTDNAKQRANALIASPTEATLTQLGLGEIKGLTRNQIIVMGRKWLKSAEALQKEVQYAKENFGKADLMNTAVRLRAELKDQLSREHMAGKKVGEVENYLPGLYDGEIYGDNSVTFSSIVLGKSYGKPKTFANQYEAIAAGPYIPKMNNVADIAAHRVRSGMYSILADQAFKAPLNMTDPVTKTPIAIQAEESSSGGYQVPGGNLQYRLVYPMGGGKPIAVRRGYAKLMEDLFGKSGIQDWVGGKGLLKLNALEKHTTLAGDVYHLAKMLYYSLAIAGKRGFNYGGGLTALEYRPSNIAEAVRKGVITKAEMDWALEPQKVYINGRPDTFTRQEILKEMQNRGLNIGRVQDAMYKHFVDKLDIEIGGKKYGIGTYNRFLFDKFTRGLMANSAVEEFLRLNKAAPKMDADVIMRRIIKDINSQFGSTGKQGLIKNPTLRDLSQLVFLAPQWFGSRIATEAKFISRLATSPYVLATQGKAAANVHMGTIGRGVGRGLVTMMALTQAINLITRGKFTWQNPEDDHKLDAFIPDIFGGPGHWISPMSVFLEVVHDVARYKMSSDKNTAEVINQIGENKLGAIGRAGSILGTGMTPTGQKITTTAGRFKEAGKAMVPFPITIGAGTRAVGHAIAPSLIAPNSPGKFQHQLYATAGIKSEVAKTAAQEMFRKANRFMEKNGLKKETGWVQVQTDQPNYTKLRNAIRSGDSREAKKQYEGLLKVRTEAQIMDAMQKFSEKPFTLSEEAEPMFRNTLTDKEEAAYEKAREQRREEFQKFREFVYRQP